MLAINATLKLFCIAPRQTNLELFTVVILAAGENSECIFIMFDNRLVFGSSE
jgi:hypothetical protein